jgi:hypothetical protein
MFYAVVGKRGRILDRHTTLREAYLDAHRRRRARGPQPVILLVCEYDPDTDVIGPTIIRVSNWGETDADGNRYDLVPMLGVHVRVAPSYHKVCIRCGTERPLNEFIPRRAMICVFCQR